MNSVSIIIPTLDAGRNFLALISALKAQTVQDWELVVIDSSSKDDTIRIARENAPECQTRTIIRDEFNHGSARNIGAEIAHGDILIFMTQDAMPANNTFIENLIEPIVEGKASASYARQVAKNVSPLEKFHRTFNYPTQSHIKNRNDLQRMGVKSLFFSNVASAVSKHAFDECRGFPESFIVNEDMYFCAKLFHRELSVAYQAKAVVVHSHEAKLLDTFRRYFDIGVYFYQSSETVPQEGMKSHSEGIRYVKRMLNYLLKINAWYLIPQSFLLVATRYLGFQLGKNERFIPPRVKRGFSGQKSFWKSDPSVERINDEFFEQGPSLSR